LHDNCIIQKSENGNCYWFAAETTAIESNPEDAEFVSSCSGAFDV